MYISEEPPQANFTLAEPASAGKKVNCSVRASVHNMTLAVCQEMALSENITVFAFLNSSCKLYECNQNITFTNTSAGEREDIYVMIKPRTTIGGRTARPPNGNSDTTGPDNETSESTSGRPFTAAPGNDTRSTTAVSTRPPRRSQPTPPPALPQWAILVLAVGGGVVLAAIITGIVACHQSKKKRKKTPEGKELTSSPNGTLSSRYVFSNMVSNDNGYQGRGESGVYDYIKSEDVGVGPTEDPYLQPQSEYMGIVDDDVDNYQRVKDVTGSLEDVYLTTASKNGSKSSMDSLDGREKNEGQEGEEREGTEKDEKKENEEREGREVNSSIDPYVTMIPANSVEKPTEDFDRPK